MAKGLLVEFYIDSKQLNFESEKQGRPVFKDVEMVRIIPLGDNKTTVEREASNDDRRRFADEYRAFKSAETQQYTGTPLKEWPQVTSSQVRLLNHFNCFTVEHVSELDDLAISRIGPGTRELVTKAKLYIANAKDGAASAAAVVENERLRNELAEMRTTISLLSAKVAAAEAA